MLRQVENGTELALEVALAALPVSDRPRGADVGTTGSAQPSPRADMVEEVSARAQTTFHSFSETEC